MKAALNHLEQFMEKSETAARGKIVLATVKGDVHDIGKNLVEIILSNNGYQVVNLGIKVPPENPCNTRNAIRDEKLSLAAQAIDASVNRETADTNSHRIVSTRARSPVSGIEMISAIKYAV